MLYKLNLNNRAFDAIKAGTKKIEIRVTTDKNKINYKNIKKGDILEFKNEKSEKIKCIVKENAWYESSLKLLEMEGTRFTLSSTNDINEGIESINRFTGYKEGIKENGIHALHIEYMNQPKIIDMCLHSENFEYIKNGTKRIELRLNDEKRKSICIGDYIEFKNSNTDDKILVRVIALLNYEKLEDLISDYKIESLINKYVTKDELINMFNDIYSIEKQKEYNILGIKFEIV